MERPPGKAAFGDFVNFGLCQLLLRQVGCRDRLVVLGSEAVHAISSRALKVYHVPFDGRNTPRSKRPSPS